MKDSFLLIILLIVSLLTWHSMVQCQSGNGYDTHGVPKQGYPSWPERSSLTLVNLIRMCPMCYRTQFAFPNLPTNMVTRKPLYGHFDLDRASRAHSDDMRQNGCFQHDSCDGTVWSARIRSYYNFGTIAENIYMGNTASQEALRAWMHSQGHRNNILSNSYNVMGTGTSVNYWTQNFGGGSANAVSPIVSGSHFFLKSGKITFFLNVYNASLLTSQGPQSVSLVLNQTSYDMNFVNFKYNNAANSKYGTFDIELDRSSQCRKYHFRVVDAEGREHTYPSVGEFFTQGEISSCTNNYDSAPSPSPPTPPSPTPSPESPGSISLATAIPSLSFYIYSLITLSIVIFCRSYHFE